MDSKNIEQDAKLECPHVHWLFVIRKYLIPSSVIPLRTIGTEEVKASGRQLIIQISGAICLYVLSATFGIKI